MPEMSIFWLPFAWTYISGLLAFAWSIISCSDVPILLCCFTYMCIEYTNVCCMMYYDRGKHVSAELQWDSFRLVGAGLVSGSDVTCRMIYLYLCYILLQLLITHNICALYSVYELYWWINTETYFNNLKTFLLIIQIYFCIYRDYRHSVHGRGLWRRHSGHYCPSDDWHKSWTSQGTAQSHRWPLWLNRYNFREILLSHLSHLYFSFGCVAKYILI